MSSKAHRRRPKSSAAVKQAFEDNDDDDEKQEKQHQHKTREIFDEYEPSLDRINNNIRLDQVYERGFFTINDSTVEVILDNDILSWLSVPDEISLEELNQRNPTNRDNMESINLQNVYAISPLYNQWNWVLNNPDSQTGMTVSTSINNNSSSQQLRGFQLHSYERMNENILQEILVIFQSNLPTQIDRWYQLLSKIIAEYKPSHDILVLCNPYAGSRHSRHIYNTKIKPIFVRAHYNVTYLEIDDLCPAEDVLNNFEGDFSSLYGLVIIGGDGSVINVINALIRYFSKENRTNLDTDSDLPSLPFPLCIVPNGTTNIICHSIHGNTDYYTPILHLLFNQQMKIDMSAIFDVNYNFVTANFSAGVGYPANALRYFTRYIDMSPKKTIQKSFVKAASKKNLRPIEIEIRYIPADQNDVSNTRCYQGCHSCTPATTAKTDDQVKAFDNTHIQKIGKRTKALPLNNGHNHRLLSSSGKTSNDQEKNWKILRHNYLQVGVLTNANLWSFAPQGLSKFGHLSDGLLDLILIEQTTRKEFLRYVKRNANSKDQYEFSFTKLIKVKEIEIELKSLYDDFINEIRNTDNQVDSSLSEDSSNEEQSNNENKSSVVQRFEPRPLSAPRSGKSRRRQGSNEQTFQTSKSMDPSIFHLKNRNQQQSDNELDSPQIDPYGSNTSLRRKNIFQSLKLKKDKVPLPRPSSSRGDEKQSRKNQRSAGGTLRPARSLLNLLTGGNYSTDMKQDSSSNGHRRRPSVISRSSSTDNSKPSPSVNNEFLYKKQPCMWNLDFTPYNSPLIRIKCFYRFLPVFGVGLHPDTKLKEVNYSCFGRLG